eukprot:9478206-Pyramimonas_sp.AAC.1
MAPCRPSDRTEWRCVRWNRKGIQHLADQPDALASHSRGASKSITFRARQLRSEEMRAHRTAFAARRAELQGVLEQLQADALAEGADMDVAGVSSAKARAAELNSRVAGLGQIKTLTSELESALAGWALPRAARATQRRRVRGQTATGRCQGAV